MSYDPEPSIASSIYAIEVAQGPDSETIFLKMYDAFEKLPIELPARIEGRRAIHGFSYSSGGHTANRLADTKVSQIIAIIEVSVHIA